MRNGGLGGFGVVVLGLNVMAVRKMCVMGGPVMMAIVVVLVRFVMVLGGMLVMLGGVSVMLGCGMRLVHRLSPLCAAGMGGGPLRYGFAVTGK